jgi:hypothetical protein
MRNEELDAKCCTASSGVSLVSAARQEPQKWPLLEKGKLALASVGAMGNVRKEQREKRNEKREKRRPSSILHFSFFTFHLLNSRGHFFRHQFINDLGRAFMGGLRFGHKVIDCHVLQAPKTHFPLGEPVTANGTKSNFIIGNATVSDTEFALWCYEAVYTHIVVVKRKIGAWHRIHLWIRSCPYG